MLYPPHRCRTEYLADPIGLDENLPRFSWDLHDDRPGAVQTAFQIEFSSASGQLLHDTGKIASSQSTQVDYPGPPLTDRQRVIWRVRTWDHTGVQSPWSAPAFFELGISGKFDATWISSDHVGGPRTTAPPPYLRRAFRLPASPLSARLYITALGTYEPRLNGQRIAQDELTPGWTNYRKTIYYQTYDVTPLLRQGDNVLAAILADGWYAGTLEWRGRQFYGDRPYLLARLEVTCLDGSTHTLTSDASWKTSPGEILESDLLNGESIDARQHQPGWDTTNFDDAHWRPVRTTAPPITPARITGQRHEPVRITQTLAPVAAFEKKDWPASRHTLDFGQNLVGKLRLTVTGEPNTTVKVRYAEILKQGPATCPGEEEIYTENLRSARQTDYFTLGPSGEATFETRFTFHGFRYADIQAWPGKLTSHSAVALVMHSAFEQVGTFECSDALINQLQKNIQWGWRGNAVDIPTDCPQRDERLGWTGDAQVFVRTAIFNYDTAAFWSKWAQDVADAQQPSGGIPPTCPSTDIMPQDGGPAWADAALICPHTVHLAYGDTRLLARHYDTLQRFVAFLDNTQRDGVRGIEGTGSWAGFGDWLSINADTPKDLIGSAFYAHAHHLMADIATYLDKPTEAATHLAAFHDLAAKFRDRYLTPAGRMVVQTQTAALLPLQFDLLLPEQRKPVTDDLVADIRARGTLLSCGFVGSSYLNHVLTREGHLALAYELLHQKQWPSWLYAVTQGATTIWERWDGWTHDKGFQNPGMNSFNHYAYGAIGSWLYQVVAGLEAAAPGYRKLRLHPHPGGHLTHARATHRTPYGTAESGWKIDSGKLLCRYIVPPNTTADIVNPVNGSVENVLAGTHERAYPWPP